MHQAQPIGLATQYNLCNKPWENFPLSNIMATLDSKLYDYKSPNTKIHCIQTLATLKCTVYRKALQLSSGYDCACVTLRPLG